MHASYYPLITRDEPALLSLVIPVYNEEECLSLLFTRLDELMSQVAGACEVILVNDGSSDRSVEQMIAKAHQDARYRVIGLARNFGHQLAATAGLEAASGDAVVLMDADLQDPPQLVLEMLRKYREGYDVVYAHRLERQGDPLFKRATAWLFYRMMKTLIHPDLPTDVGDFRLMSRACLDALISMQELHRFLRGMVTWLGFPQTKVDFVRAPRAAGGTKYPLRRMLALAWSAALSFSTLPLRLAFLAGTGLLTVALTYAGYSFWRMMNGGFVVPGWMSLVIMNCITSGALMMAVGILGEYVGRIFEEVKRRPLYTVALRVNPGPGGRPPAASPYKVTNIT